jgi:hypothetical protein
MEFGLISGDYLSDQSTVATGSCRLTGVRGQVGGVVCPSPAWMSLRLARPWVGIATVSPQVGVHLSDRCHAHGVMLARAQGKL